MANRATLISKATADYTSSDVGSGFLATKYSIGVFWPSLFQEDNLCYLDQRDAEDGRLYRIPYLVTRAEDAVTRWRRRRQRFTALSAKGQEAAGLFDAQLGALNRSYLILDAWEIWMMNAEGFDKFLLESIAQSENGDLTALFEQANIDEKDGLDEVHEYMGFSWNSL